MKNQFYLTFWFKNQYQFTRNCQKNQVSKMGHSGWKTKFKLLYSNILRIFLEVFSIFWTGEYLWALLVFFCRGISGLSCQVCHDLWVWIVSVRFWSWVFRRLISGHSAAFSVRRSLGGESGFGCGLIVGEIINCGINGRRGVSTDGVNSVQRCVNSNNGCWWTGLAGFFGTTPLPCWWLQLFG